MSKLLESTLERIKRFKLGRDHSDHIRTPSLHDAIADTSISGQLTATQTMDNDKSISTPSHRQRTSHMFQGAHHFVVNNPIMVNQTVVNPDVEAAGMKLLLERGIAEATLDSSARYPPPLCHPGTREDIRNRITSWITNNHRGSNLLWLYGPAGIGKSAVAQTIAEYCQEHGWLGAAFFFSRPNKRNDPYRVIPSLAYQLALFHSAYKQNVTQLITHDPSILHGALHAQFQKLIGNLLPCLYTGGTSVYPVLLVLDGLDECDGDDAQKRLIELVASFSSVCHRSGSPFLWIITSRPEWQIVSTFEKVESAAPCIKEELRVDSRDAQRDVSIFLRAGFKNIRDKYSDAFSPQTIWPTESEFLVICCTASGLFAFADTALKFIGDDEIGNPVAQLQACLDFLKGRLTPAGENPLDPLNTLYRGILRTIHPKILPTMMQILAQVFLVETPLPAQHIANFLLLDQATFYASLRRLHSVLIIPSPESAEGQLIQTYHASFADFLRHAYETGEFGLTRTDITAATRKQCIQWFTKWKAYQAGGSDDAGKILTWPGASPSLAFSVFRHAKAELLRIWSDTSEEDMPQMYEEVRDFDIQSIPPSELHACVAPLCRLSSWQQRRNSYGVGYNIVRFEPVCLMDHYLFREYGSLISHNDMKKGDLNQLTQDLGGWNFWILPANGGPKPGLQYFHKIRAVYWNPDPCYFLLGYGANTCLIIAYRLTSTRQYVSEAFERIRNTYSISTYGGGSWPTQQHLDTIVAISAIHTWVSKDGLSPLARGIMAFIGDPTRGDPVGRLNWIINVLTCPDKSKLVLDLLCQQMLSDIPWNLRPAAHRILAFFLTSSFIRGPRVTPWPMSVQDICEFLAIDEDTVLKALQTLNILIFKCPLSQSMKSKLGDHDFIWFSPPGNQEQLNIVRIGQWWLGGLQDADSRVWLDVATCSIRWSNYFLMKMTMQKDKDSYADGKDSRICRELSIWREFMGDGIERRFEYYVFCGLWPALSWAAERHPKETVDLLRGFRFSHLHIWYGVDMGPSHQDRLISFVNKLYSVQTKLDLEPIVRVEGNCDEDNQLFEKWNKFNVPYRKASFPIDKLDARIAWISLHHDMVPEDLNSAKECRIFLIGHGANSCVMALKQL